MSRRTIVVLAIIAAILVAVFLITRWQRNIATQKLLAELAGNDYSRIEDAMTQLKERGRSIVPQLVQHLQAKEYPSSRWRAATLLGDVGTRAAWEPLTAALQDVSPDVRAAAALALGKLRVKTATQALQARLSDPKEDLAVRIAAAQALGLIGDPSASQALREQLSDTLEALQAAAEAATKAVTDAETALKKAEEDAAKATPDKLADAQKAVETARKTLDEAKKTEGDALRRFQAAARKRPSGPQPPPPVQTTADAAAAPAPTTDTRRELRVACARALGTIGDDDSVGALVDALKADNEPAAEVRVAAAYALGDFVQRPRKAAVISKVVSALVEAADKKTGDKVGDVRIAALCSMAQLNVAGFEQTRAEEALKKALQDDHFWAREAAKRAMERMGIPVPQV